MGLTISQVTDRAELKRWVEFPYSHYRRHPYWVPPLRRDELAYFDARRNPAFEVADVKLFLALAGTRAVGRICGIINPLETRKLGRKRGRFGWFETIDDAHVAGALLDSVRSWCRAEGCDEMTGPHGFSDLDVEGLLVEGFDALPTISGSYNYPYYRPLIENYGFEKAVDYVEYRNTVPTKLPLLERLRARYGDSDAYRVVTCSSRKALLSHAEQLWQLLEQAFAPLYGVVPLTPRQTAYYTKKYFGFLDPDFVKLTFSRDGELVGFFIAMPNLSTAFKKAGGRLFPLGLWHILRALRHPQTVDFLLAGVKPGEPTSIITAVTLIDMYETLRRRGVRYTETNHELEDNTTVNRIWSKFETVYFRRSRIFRLPLP